MCHNSLAAACKLEFSETCGNKETVALAQINGSAALSGEYAAALENEDMYEALVISFKLCTCVDIE